MDLEELPDVGKCQISTPNCATEKSRMSFELGSLESSHL